MITLLSYTIRFAKTGRVLANTLDFGAGMTAIVGANEAGKSMVVEMIRYAFFGSAALRGVAEDYAELRVKMAWKDYVIERTPKGGKVWKGTEVLATGTKAMNAKVLEVLGFGLDVFDVGIVCNQGDVERLGAMTATERKNMVDRVIGASRIEEVQKWAAEQMSLTVREIAVLERGLVAPVEPVKPEGYCDAAELRTYVGNLRELKREHDELVGWLSHKRVAPVAPTEPALTNLTLLENEFDDARWYENEVKRITALPVVDFDVDALAKQWAAYTLWDQRCSFEQRHPRPTIDEFAYADEVKLREQKELWDELHAKGAKLACDRIECPHCHQDFALQHDELQHVEIQMERVGKPEREPSSKQWVADQRRRLDDWANADTIRTWDALKDAVETPQPTVTQAQLAAAQRAGHCSSEERQAMLDILRKPAMSVAEAQKAIGALQRYWASKEVYEREKVSYDAWHSEKHDKEGRLHELLLLVGELPEAEALLKAVETYDRDLAAYTAAKEFYDARIAEVNAKREEIDGWKAARQGLIDVRTRVKTYLVPSLSRVASSLLNQMTGGQRSSIVVNEDFDIAVDGQRLETLSGSGKAVANLALRIALGQVLTNRVVSLFVGDEIDASMDDVRAAATHSSIRSLRAQVLQTILVSHKFVDADRVSTLASSGA